MLVIMFVSSGLIKSEFSCCAVCYIMTYVAKVWESTILYIVLQMCKY